MLETMRTHEEYEEDEFFDESDNQPFSESELPSDRLASELDAAMNSIAHEYHVPTSDAPVPDVAQSQPESADMPTAYAAALKRHTDAVAALSGSERDAYEKIGVAYDALHAAEARAKEEVLADIAARVNTERTNGVISAEAIEALLAEHHIAPGSPESEEFLETWDKKEAEIAYDRMVWQFDHAIRMQQDALAAAERESASPEHAGKVLALQHALRDMREDKVALHGYRVLVKQFDPSAVQQIHAGDAFSLDGYLGRAIDVDARTGAMRFMAIDQDASTAPAEHETSAPHEEQGEAVAAEQAEAPAESEERVYHAGEDVVLFNEKTQQRAILHITAIIDTEHVQGFYKSSDKTAPRLSKYNTRNPQDYKKISIAYIRAHEWQQPKKDQKPGFLRRLADRFSSKKK